MAVFVCVARAHGLHLLCVQIEGNGTGFLGLSFTVNQMELVETGYAEE